MDGLAHLKNRWVNFKLREIFVPPPEEILKELHGEDILQGRVIGFTEGGTSVYVVAEVAGLAHAVIVPVERILGVL
jgi:hypothetical protein